MAQYNFELPPELIDETVRVFSPRELAQYMYHNYREYMLEAIWEVETIQLDNLYAGFDSLEEYEEAQPSLFPELD